MQWTFWMAFEVVFREMLCHCTKLNTCSQQIVKVGKSCDLCSERQTNCKLKEVAETCDAKRRYGCGDLDIEFAGMGNLFANFADLKSLHTVAKLFSAFKRLGWPGNGRSTLLIENSRPQGNGRLEQQFTTTNQPTKAQMYKIPKRNSSMLMTQGLCYSPRSFHDVGSPWRDVEFCPRRRHGGRGGRSPRGGAGVRRRH